MSFTANRRLMVQVFPASLRNLWDNWDHRIMVLVSLAFQTVLVLFGNKRKHNTGVWLRIMLWLSYLSADGLATIALSILQSKLGQQTGDLVEPKYVIVSLWAPLLLLHLGGPDTITAYSMEDNELWSRKLLTFGVQVCLAFYIFLRAWANTEVNVLAIPIFVAGIVKIGERIWVLRSASTQQFKESLFPDPDPGPSYARYMEAYMAASDEGYLVDAVSLIESPSIGGGGGDHAIHVAAGEEGYNFTASLETDTYGPQILTTAHKFLTTFKRLFADLILTVHDVLESRLSLQNAESEQVFEVMEVELGFMYDLFYTKAAVVYSSVGSFLRFVTLSCNVGVLCVFYAATEKNQYPKSDLIITHVLLLGAVILELYSVISLLYSDWAMLWLVRHKNKVTSLIMWAISSPCSLWFVDNKRWSGNIGQFNLINFCLRATERQRCGIIHKILSIKFCRKSLKKKAGNCCLARMIVGAYQSYQKYMHNDITTVTPELKRIIFEHYINKIREVKTENEVKSEQKVALEIKKFCDDRGSRVLKSLECYEKLRWSVEAEFDQSILLWHIATDLLFSDSGNKSSGPPDFREASKLLSDYMLYLLVMRPFMLPNGIGEIRFQDTCAEASEFFEERKSINGKKEAWEKLRVIVKSKKVLPSQVKGDKSKSVLFDACRLATLIEELKEGDEWITHKMWEFITQVWVEMVGYAACHCQGIRHAQQLRKGGELLTHVWLLMAHLGMTDQFQISVGDGRTKLTRK